MKQLYIFHLFLILPFFLCAQIVTPEVINTGGGLLQAENLAMSYSIGEAVVPTLGDSLPVFTQGFEQPDSIMVLIVDTYGFDPNTWDLKIYPNPTADWLAIEFTGSQQPLSAEIWSISGQLLLSTFKLQANSQNLINVNPLPPGSYLIRLEDEKQNFATFQFIKINH